MFPIYPLNIKDYLFHLISKMVINMKKNKKKTIAYIVALIVYTIWIVAVNIPLK